MTTGVFARRSRLSQKALRLYDAMGLLNPAYVDEHTGYRYYLETQLEKARLIALLRQLEMPLNQIAQVLDLETKAAIQAIGRYWHEIEKDMANKRRLVHYLEGYLEAKGEAMYEVFEREVSEQSVLSVKKSVYIQDLETFIDTSMTHMLDYLERSNLKPSGAHFIIFHGQVNDDSDGPVEVCIPCAARLEPEGDITSRLEPAHREAYTRISKVEMDFPGILEAYDAVAKHLKAKALSICDSPREIYLTSNWKASSDDDLVCDIAFPY